MTIPRRRYPDNYPDKRIEGLKKEIKLTVDQVDEIRWRYRFYSRTTGMRALAREYGVSSTTIYNIVREKKWRFDTWEGRRRSLEPEMPPMTNLNKFYARTADALENHIRGLLSLTGNAAEAVLLYDNFCTSFNRPRPEFLEDLLAELEEV